MCIRDSPNVNRIFSFITLPSLFLISVSSFWPALNAEANRHVTPAPKVKAPRDHEKWPMHTSLREGANKTGRTLGLHKLAQSRLAKSWRDVQNYPKFKGLKNTEHIENLTGAAIVTAMGTGAIAAILGVVAGLEYVHLGHTLPIEGYLPAPKVGLAAGTGFFALATSTDVFRAIRHTLDKSGKSYAELQLRRELVKNIEEVETATISLQAKNDGRDNTQSHLDQITQDAQ